MRLPTCLHRYRSGFASLAVGFTIVELLLVLSVVGIISAVGVGTFQDYADTRRTSVAADDFASVLQAAESRALSQIKPASCGTDELDGYRVVICPGGCSTTQTYVLEAYCGGIGHQVGDVYQLPSGVTFSSQTEQSVLFRTITGAVETTGDVLIQSGQKVRTVSISGTGVIALSGLDVITPTGGPSWTITPTPTITLTPTTTPTPVPPTNTPIPTFTITPTVTPTPLTPPPTVNFIGNTVIPSGQTTTLSWTSSGATSCTGSNGAGSWAGAKSLSGNHTTSALTSNTTYALTCSNDSGDTVKTAVVSVITGDVRTAQTAPTTDTLDSVDNFKNMNIRSWVGPVTINAFGMYIENGSGDYEWELYRRTDGTGVIGTAELLATSSSPGMSPLGATPDSQGYYYASLGSGFTFPDENYMILRVNMTDGRTYSHYPYVGATPVSFDYRSTGANTVNTLGTYPYKIFIAPVYTPTPTITPIPTATRTPTPTPTIGPSSTPTPTIAGTVIYAISNPEGGNDQTDNVFKSTLFVPQSNMTLKDVGMYISGAGAGGESFEVRVSDSLGSITGTLLASGTLPLTPTESKYYTAPVTVSLTQGSYYVFRTTNNGKVWRKGTANTSGAIHFLKRGNGNTAPADNDGTYAVRFIYE